MKTSDPIKVQDSKLQQNVITATNINQRIRLVSRFGTGTYKMNRVKHECSQSYGGFYS